MGPAYHSFRANAPGRPPGSVLIRLTAAILMVEGLRGQSLVSGGDSEHLLLDRRGCLKAPQPIGCWPAFRLRIWRGSIGILSPASAGPLEAGRGDRAYLFPRPRHPSSIWAPSDKVWT